MPENVSIEVIGDHLVRRPALEDMEYDSCEQLSPSTEGSKLTAEVIFHCYLFVTAKETDILYNSDLSSTLFLEALGDTD